MTNGQKRKQLFHELYERCYSQAVEHFHTTNPPEHEGWIVREEFMADIRRIVSELSRLKNWKE